jgi:hypothetical protein
VDGHQFDALTQRLTSTRLTRGGALRGMVAGALTVAGIARVADEASAGKRRKVCHCGDVAGPTACTTEPVGKKQRRAHLRDHQCDYLGACRGNTACAAAPIIINIDRLGTACSSNNPCGNNSGLRCVANLCVPIDLGDSCTNDRECSTGRCTGGLCVDCLPVADICGAGSTLQCCTVGASCDSVDNVCVL